MYSVRTAPRSGGRKQVMSVLLLLSSLGTGCVSLPGVQPPSAGLSPLPYVEQARCGDFSLAFHEAFNGEVDQEEAAEPATQERAALTELVNGLVAETGLVGYVGQDGLEGVHLKMELRRDVRASVLHGVASALTLFLAPYWVEVSYELRGEILDGERAVASSRSEASWYVVVHPFLFVAYPFDEPTDLGDLVRRMTRSVLTGLVEGETQ
jgi:hypothetical protein